MSQLKVNSISHPSGSSNNVTFDSSGNMTVGGSVVPSSPFMFRNRIINGDTRIDQRNAGASQTITAAAALAYTVDRWYAYCTGANVTGQRVAGAVTNTFRYQFTGAASVTAIGFAQRIEALNSADLAGTTATLSVDLSNSLLTTVTWTAFYANSNDTFGTLASPTRTQIATGTFTVSSTVTRYSTQISIPAAATTGIEIVFTVGAQTSGTWVIGNVQLEAGSIATPFERRLLSAELSLAQRYYYRWNSNGVAYAQFAIGRSYSTTQGTCNIWLPTPMRVLPTFNSSTVNSTNFDYGLSALALGANGINPGVPGGSIHSVSLGATGSFSGVGGCWVLAAGNTTNVIFVDFTAEL